jgi:hypothetical protein
MKKVSYLCGAGPGVGVCVESAGDFSCFGEIGQSVEEVIAVRDPDFFFGPTSIALQADSGDPDLMMAPQRIC